MEHSPEAKAALLEAVGNQIAGEEAPEVRAEYQRLIREGIPDERAREAIALVLGCHIVTAMKRKRPFDYAAYVAELRKLPDFDLDRPL